MRTIRWLGTATLFFSGLSLTAQQTGVSAQQSASAGSHISESGDANASAQAHPGASTGSTTNSSVAAGPTGASSSVNSASSGAYAAGDMRTVSGELQSKLDAKTAKVGDQVVLKTSQKMKTADGTQIPRGTRLVGHVTDVQAHGSGHADSQLGLAFDRAELKNGQSIAIHSMIESVEPRSNAVADDSMAADDSLAAPVGGGIAGGARGGGGGRLLGGGAPIGGAVQGVGNTTAETGAHLTSVAGNTTRAATGTANHAVSGVGAEAHAAGSAGGELTAHATGVPGVMLQGGASDASSGMLSASKKNVHLDSGTQMELGIVTTARQ